MELKRAAAKGSNAVQKAKKKQVEEEIVKLSTKLKEKHAKELDSLGYNGTSSVSLKDNHDNLVKAIAVVSMSGQSEHGKVSKSVKKRDKRGQQEAAREKRVQEEQQNMVSDRMLEDEKLEKKPEPLGLTINEIKPDGHCLYRAVEDQLAFLSGGSFPYTYQQRREMASWYMRENTSSFLPFFLSENMVEGDTDSSITKKFENYCKEVDSMAAWGGQLELGGPSHYLRRHILMFSGLFPGVEMGKEYEVNGGSGASCSSIKPSYHKHAFGL